MLFKHLSRSFNQRFNIGTNLLKHNDNKTWTSSIFIQNYTKSSREIDEELNKPLQYTTSPAGDWKAQHSRLGSKAEFGPWYEAHLVSASIIIFMIYFFILREENDIDLMLDKPLTDILKKE